MYLSISFFISLNAKIFRIYIITQTIAPIITPLITLPYIVLTEVKTWQKLFDIDAAVMEPPQSNKPLSSLILVFLK